MNTAQKHTRIAGLIFMVLMVVILIDGCRTSRPHDCQHHAIEEQKPAGMEKKLSATENNKALALLQSNCFSCHNPDMQREVRVAPPMFKIRQHYYTDDVKREDFIGRIVAYVNNPSEELSIMPGAVRNFGVMPKLSFKQEDLALMAEYIYENDLASDAWYDTWDAFKNLPQTEEGEINYEDIGRNIANGTKSELGKNLLAAIQERGAPGAVEFCNTRALHLTDSMANRFNATVKRVSDNPRNQQNQANEEELAYIRTLKEAYAKGEKPAPLITDKGNKVLAYYGIETNKMCLQCHGQPDKDILPATWTNLKRLYPHDKAYGYGENQIRGIFVVEMKK